MKKRTFSGWKGISGANTLAYPPPPEGGNETAAGKRAVSPWGGRASVLVADTDEALHKTVYRRFDLDQAIFTIASAFDGEEAVWMLRKFQASGDCDRLMVVADVHLPRRSGLDLCRFVRSQESLSPVPFLMVAGEGDLHELCLSSLEAGADDFLPKPFSAREFEARLGALWRRVEREDRKGFDYPFDRAESGGLVVDTQKYEVRLRGRRVHLSHKEFLVCVVLLSKIGMVVRHEEFFQSVWGEDRMVGRENLKVHVHALRNKLAGGPAIEAIRGVGYRMKADG